MQKLSSWKVGKDFISFTYENREQLGHVEKEHENNMNMTCVIYKCLKLYAVTYIDFELLASCFLSYFDSFFFCFCLLCEGIISVFDSVFMVIYVLLVINNFKM